MGDGTVGTQLAQQCHLPSGAAAGQWLPSSFSVGRKNDRKEGYGVYIPPCVSFPHTTPRLDPHLVPKPASSSLRCQVRNAMHSQLHETLTIWRAWESSPAFCTHSALDQHQQVSCSEEKPQPRSTTALQLCPQPFSQRRASLSAAGAGEMHPASDMQMWASRKQRLGVGLLRTGGSG